MGQNQFLPLGKRPLGTLTLVGWPTQSEAWGPEKPLDRVTRVAMSSNMARNPSEMEVFRIF